MTHPLDTYARSHTRPVAPPILIEEEYDDNSFSDQEERPAVRRNSLANRTPYVASPSASPSLSFQVAEHIASHSHLYPHNSTYSTRPNGSVCSTASVTPIPSRSSSPVPLYFHTTSCSSGTESDQDSPALLLGSNRRGPTWRERPRWWQMGRRRRRGTLGWFRVAKRVLRRLIRHPFVPKTPLTIILTLLILTAFGVSLTFLLIYILNPDKEPLPWRGYCTIPSMSDEPPPSTLPPTASFPFFPPKDFEPPSFPPEHFDSLPPAGVFVGVFSLDTAFERRMSIRSTWAAHARSRNGAGEGDNGVGTSRTVVRFILGQPLKHRERNIRLEMETYKDMIILPITENMNRGKSHAFFSWAATNAWVPPLYFDGYDTPAPVYSYSNVTTPAPILASHDPSFAHVDQLQVTPQPWVRPDFVVKADDDSFLMLAELEARLRVELHAKKSHRQPLQQETPHVLHPRAEENTTTVVHHSHSHLDPPSSHDSHFPMHAPHNLLASIPDVQAKQQQQPVKNDRDPLIYWGYLVKNRFMAGELYALSFSLAEWVGADAQLKTLTKGAEDKVTSKWMRLHPRSSEIRWASERCWIYDHPRAGTVYSHGFLFPSEAKRVQRDVKYDLEYKTTQQVDSSDATLGAVAWTPFGPSGVAPTAWSRSTVSTFGVRYTAPMADLTIGQSVEALVEGSDMSRLREGTPDAANYAWRYREGRAKRYDGRRVGGTIVVHFIKKNLWFLETAYALLEGDELTDVERSQRQLDETSQPENRESRHEPELDSEDGEREEQVPEVIERLHQGENEGSEVIVPRDHVP